MTAKVLIFGLGDMAARIALGLAASGRVSELVLASRNQEKGDLTAALLGASYPVRVRFIALDARDQSLVERTIGDCEPDLILQNASLMGPFILVGRQDPVARAFSAIGRGPTLPVQLPVLMSVMRAVASVGYDGPVVNLSLPDVTNPIMQRIGLAPLLGLGNAGMVEYRVRQALLKNSATDVQNLPLIRVIAHHAQVPLVMQSKMPEDANDRCRVYLGEEGARVDELAYSLPGIPPGEHYNMPTAACCLSVMLALLPKAGELRTSAPGPHGLAGGYPIHIRDGQVALDLPDGVSAAEVGEFQDRMARLDGIEKIDSEGTVTFTKHVVETLSSIDPALSEPLRLDDMPKRYELLRAVLQ